MFLGYTKPLRAWYLEPQTLLCGYFSSQEIRADRKRDRGGTILVIVMSSAVPWLPLWTCRTMWRSEQLEIKPLVNVAQLNSSKCNPFKA